MRPVRSHPLAVRPHGDALGELRLGEGEDSKLCSGISSDRLPVCILISEGGGGWGWGGLFGIGALWRWPVVAGQTVRCHLSLVTVTPLDSFRSNVNSGKFCEE